MNLDFIKCGDCMELMKGIPNGSIDMVLCDLPYGQTACQWDSALPLPTLWAEYNRILKSKGAAILFGTQPFTTTLIGSNMKAFRYCWYWVKNTTAGGAYAHYQPMRKVEDICVFYQRPPLYCPQGLIALVAPIVSHRKAKPHGIGVYRRSSETTVNYQRFTNWPTNVLTFKTERGFHPTQKPVPLLEYLIKTYTNEGETVLDNCMGSGSTGVACVNTNRNFIGIEQDPKFYEIAHERIKAAREFKEGQQND